MALTFQKCIFCDCDSDDPVFIEENGFTARKCQFCGLVYLYPRPAPEKVASLYRLETPQSIKLLDSYDLDVFKKTLYAKHHLRIIRRYINNGSLLEIGFGGGFFLNEAKKSGFETYGLELNPVLCQRARDKFGINCENNPLSKGFGSIKFDIIYHCDIISHFNNPIEEFKTINRRLNKGGFLIFETGNIEFSNKYRSLFISFQFPDHLFFFSCKNIKELLSRTGFEIVAIYKWQILPQLMMQKFYRILSKVVKFIFSEKNKTRTQTEVMEKKVPHRYKIYPWLSFVRRMHAICSAFINYFLRYQLGFILPKKNKPFTFMVIAKKIG